jgi:hypothetical protein
MSAGLLIFVVVLAGQLEGGRVLCTGLAGLAGGEEKLAGAVEHLGLPGRVAGFAKERPGEAEMAFGAMVASPPSQFGHAQVT